MDDDVGGMFTAGTDWSRTGLGARASWPVELQVLVDACAESRFPLLLMWGPDLLVVYNQAYLPLLGPEKHPWALGRPAREVWPDVFDASGTEQVLRSGRAVLHTDRQMIMDRHGYPEETYFTYSQSVVRDRLGGSAGLLITVTETTEHVLYERRLRILHALGAVPLTPADGPDAAEDPVEAACSRAVTALSANRHSAPFAVVFLTDEQDQPSFVDGYGFDAAVATDRGWLPVPPVTEVFEVLADGRTRVLSGLRERFGIALLPGPIGPLLPDQAVILPIAVTGAAGPVGVVVIGVNPYRPVDEGYLEFAELAARQFGIIVGDALTLRQELSRRRALADADQAKTQFLQQVSHELRSPLTLLLPPLIDLLSDPPEPLGPQSRTAVEAAVRGGRRLQRMVDALLDVARADAGALDPDPVPIDLAAATAQVAAAFGDAATGAGLTLTVDGLAEPVTALVDPTMWTTIVTNLIDNAIKYTGRGGITLTVARAPTGEPEVRVADTGAGIDPEDQERVFGPFPAGRHPPAGRGPGPGPGQGPYRGQRRSRSVDQQPRPGQHLHYHPARTGRRRSTSDHRADVNAN